MHRTHRDPRNFERLAGELLFFPELPDGDFEKGAINIGDIEMHKRSTTVEKKTHYFHPRSAILTAVREDVTKSENRYEITGADHYLEIDEILLFGTRGAPLAQAAGTEQTITLNGVKTGRTYLLGKLNVTNVAAKVGATAKKIGVRDSDGEIVTTDGSAADLVLNAELGSIEILESGTIADEANVIFTFDCPAVDLDVIHAGTKYQRRGRFHLMEYDGEAKPFRRRHVFTGDLAMKDAGDNKVDGDANKYVLEVLVRGEWDVQQQP